MGGSHISVWSGISANVIEGIQFELPQSLFGKESNCTRRPRFDSWVEKIWVETGMATRPVFWAQNSMNVSS